MINSMGQFEARENPHDIRDQLKSSLARNAEMELEIAGLKQQVDDLVSACKSAEWNSLDLPQFVVDELRAAVAKVEKQRASH